MSALMDLHARAIWVWGRQAKNLHPPSWKFLVEYVVVACRFCDHCVQTKNTAPSCQQDDAEHLLAVQRMFVLVAAQQWQAVQTPCKWRGYSLQEQRRKMPIIAWLFFLFQLGNGWIWSLLGAKGRREYLCFAASSCQERFSHCHCSKIVNAAGENRQY